MTVISARQLTQLQRIFIADETRVSGVGSAVTENRNLIVFDGVCNLCSASVSFIIKRDPQSKFVFTPVQSELAVSLMKQYKVNETGIDTFVLIKNDQCFEKSAAALEISKDLSGLWRGLAVLVLIPRPIRDFLYDSVAKNRYRLFGRKAVCMVPTDDVKSRFIGL